MFFGLLASILAIAIFFLRFSGFLEFENGMILGGIALLAAGCVLVGPFFVFKSLLDLLDIKKKFYIQITDNETGVRDWMGLNGHNPVSLDGSKFRKV